MNRLEAALAIMLVIAASGLIGSACATIPDNLATVGGPGWRVTDATLLTTPQRDALLRVLHAEVETCIGVTRELGSLELYSVSSILYYSANLRMWNLGYGMWQSEERTGGNERIYYMRDRADSDEERNTLRHELIHFVSGLVHPEVDMLIDLCAPVEPPDFGDVLDQMFEEMR